MEAAQASSLETGFSSQVGAQIQGSLFHSQMTLALGLALLKDLMKSYKNVFADTLT